MAAPSLRAAADRLVARVGHWTPQRWQTAAAGAAGTRADVVHALVQRLADLGAEAEARAPRPVPRLDNDLALPDQVRVMVADLILATPGDPALLSATTLLNSTLRAL